jgi:type I restriction enzyme S subunit
VPSYWKGTIPWASVKDFPEQAGVITDTQEYISVAGLNASASNLIPADTPLVCTRMAVGRAAMAPVAMAINQDVKAIFPAAGVSPAYLLRLLQFIQARAEARAVGSTVKGIRIQDYLDIAVPIADANAQPVIAVVLDTLDSAIHETEAIIAKLKAVKQGLLHDLLTRGIDANGELRPLQTEAPHLYKESPLGWIPKEWKVETIVHYLDRDIGIKPGPFGSSIKKDSYSKTGFKVYGQEQVIGGDQDLGDYFIPLLKYRELSDFSVASGDVLISLVGTIGRVLVLRDPLQPGLINPRLMRLRPDQRVARPDFVGLLLLSPAVTRQLLAFAGGGTMPVINKRVISSVLVPLIPREEQDAILRTCWTIEGRISNEEAYFEKMQLQRAGLMDDLLTGRVRVTPLLED